MKRKDYSMQQKSRLSNFELCRIIAMFRKQSKNGY